MVLRDNKWAYSQWLLANLGGLAIAYTAIATIWLFHLNFGNYTPGPQEWLITAAISVAVAGVSYGSLARNRNAPLSPVLWLTWPFLLAIVYGILISMGVQQDYPATIVG
jgi:hypothetical protein